MKRFFLILPVAAFAIAAGAQTSQNSSAPATTKSTATTSAASPSSTKTATATATPAAPTTPPWIKLPAGIPKVVHGPIKPIPFVVHYEDVKLGTGAVGESGKLWHIKYTGWRAADGIEFDSWDKHTRPVMGKDGKPELGPDGKPKMGDPEPASIPQGVGGTIPGFDYGIAGMKIGGKRRIFIPWQLGYGTRSIPDRPDHPGIPAKSDLIFDVELVDVTDMPAQRPMMPRPMPPHPNGANPPGAAGAKPATPGQPATGAPAQPAAQPATPPPATTTTPPSTTPQPQATTPPATTQPPATTTPPSTTQPQSH
jgi:peptidylprolyl isomerase